MAVHGFGEVHNGSMALMPAKRLESYRTSYCVHSSPSHAPNRDRTVHNARWSGELIHRRRDGIRLVVASLWALHRNGSKTPAFVIEVNNDITEIADSREALRHQERTLDRLVAERTAALSESQRNFRLLIDGIRDYALVMLDPSGRVTTWNRGGGNRRLRGLGDDWPALLLLLYAGGSRGGRSDRCAACSGLEDHHEVEYLQIRKNATLYRAHVVLNVIRDDGGVLLGSPGSCVTLRHSIRRDWSWKRRSAALCTRRNGGHRATDWRCGSRFQ